MLQSAKKLDAYANGRDNNFNLVRMIAASGVLVSHAYPLSLGRAAQEPFEATLQGITLGALCVMVFFGISGFLIARSFERSSTFRRFVMARVFRLFPALAVVLLITVLVAAIWFSEGSEEALWRAAPQYFFRNITLYLLQYELPGVFETNPYGPAINGSLWTLNHEVSCYAGVVVLGFLGALANKGRMGLLLALFVVGYSAMIILDPHPRLVSLAKLAWPFYVGVAFYVWRDKLALSWRIGFLIAALAVVSHFTLLFHEVFTVAVIYWVFLIGYLPSGAIRRYNSLGDYSYGTYIYAYPVQQVLANTLSPMTPLENIILAFPIVLVCAALSWRLVEKPALSLSGRTGRPPLSAVKGA